MDGNNFINQLLRDVKIDVTQEFDRNFERKAFFDQRWPEARISSQRGSLMMRSGGLRGSINSRLEGSSIVWSSSLPYASIHNEGGEITVTARMKSFFWAMYYKAAGAITTRANGAASTSKRNQNLTAEASKWKAMALMPVGTKMKIEKRQFIGDHQVVRGILERAYDLGMRDVEQYILNSLRHNR